LPYEPATTELREIAWIRPLAQPYLRGCRALPQRSGSLRGYWFFHPASSRAVGVAESEVRGGNLGSRDAAGFFIGYLNDSQGFEYLSPHPPECLIFAFAHPTGGESHERLVRQPGSLVRATFEYIRWLTHRPPRFVFHEGESAAMVRHVPMVDWPVRRRRHLSQNFFIETLAWLVRSGLVRRLLAESLAGDSSVRSRVPKQRKPAPIRKTRLSGFAIK